MRFWKDVSRVMKESDVIIEIIDARMPELSRNSEVEKLVNRNNKKLIVVFNKIDLVNKEIIDKLRKEHKGWYFVSVAKNIGIPKLRRDLQILGKKSGFAKLRIGIIGYPNVGKSSLINILARRAKTKVSKKAGTTRGIQWVGASNLKIMDTPGVIPTKEWDEVKLAIINAKDPGKLKDPEKVALEIIEMFLDVGSKPYGVEGQDSYEIFEDIARKKGFLRKKGEIDDKRTAIVIIQDWQKGKLKL